MSVKISGVMKDAMGKPIPDCTIALKALHTTATVITKTVGSLQPEENGSYSMDVELGKYSVTLCVEGYPTNDVGEIYVHSQSVPGTLNYYLGLPTEGDLPPAAIQQFEAMVELVSQQAAQVEKDKAAAAASAKAAKLSETNAKTSETNAGKSAAAALVSEKAAKTSETNTAKGIEAAAASAQAAKLSETNADGSKKAAQTSATEALASQGAAKTSETNAGNSAKAASGSADKAKSEADRATTATDGKQDKNALLTAIAALNTAADQIITLTGKNSVATAVLTKFAKEMLAKTDADGVREYLGLKEALIRGNFGLGNYTPILADADTLTSQNGFHGGGGVNGVNFFDPYAPMIHASRGNQSFQIQSGVGTSRLAVRGSSDGGKSWSIWTESVAKGDFGVGSLDAQTQKGAGIQELGNGWYSTSGNSSYPDTGAWAVRYDRYDRNSAVVHAYKMGYSSTKHYYRVRSPSGWQTWKQVWTEENTTIDTNGFIKRASPVVKLFSDGSSELNSESEGVTVSRESVGVYRISGVLGMNSDGTWGGIDGGFEVPTDRNGQRLLWLDYEVEADGSILVKTYHRTYPDSPVFARNIKDGYEEGDLIDIPSDQFLSVRVEMPQDSIYNLSIKESEEQRKLMDEIENDKNES